MCGIAGYLGGATVPGRADEGEALLRRMGQAIAHRGPDDTGVWVDAGAGIGVVHRRLSILDLSPAGHQPMFSASGRYAIIYNGEIYNFRELRAELETAGVLFKGASDTEVILALIERGGMDAAIRRLNGMFALAVWD